MKALDFLQRSICSLKSLFLLLLHMGAFLLLEADESVEKYKGEPASFLTFSSHFPIEMDALNEEVVKREEKELFSRNMQSQEEKSLPWQKIFLGMMAFFGFFALRYWSRPVSEKALENKKTVQEETKLQLKELQLKKLPSEVYYRELSFIFRTFLERRYGIHAPKETTEEFLKKIENGEEFAFLREKDLKIFLNFSDLVKFSGTPATLEEQKKAYQTVLEVVENRN